jgi:hypothetical protein
MAKSPVSPIGRVSFPTVFEAREYAGKSNFSIVLLFDKTDPGLKVLAEKALSALKDKFGDKAPKSFKPGDYPAKWSNPFVNGDESDVAGYEGKIAIRFKSKTKPQVVDGQRNPITEDSGRLYAGCFARVSYSVYAFDNESKGVAFGLVNVQKTGDGEPFSARTDAEEDFNDGISVESDLPADADMFA